MGRVYCMYDNLYLSLRSFVVLGQRNEQLRDKIGESDLSCDALSVVFLRT